MRLSLVLPTLAVIAALPVVAFPGESHLRQDLPVPTASSPYCHSGNPLRGVYLPGRFTLHSRCTSQTGRVTALVREADGDVHIHLTGVNPKLLRPANNGHLVVERIPAFPIKLPAVGSRVTMVGPFVTDNFVHHGWNEIHPVWHITVHFGRELATTETARIPLDPHPPDPEDEQDD